MEELIIDPKFRDKIPPLRPEERERLEKNILSDGEVFEPIVVWRGVIIDGHNRWEIIRRHPELRYAVKEMDFPDEWAAVAWMCANQLGRRNLTDEQRTYLLGKEYEARKNSHGGDRKSKEAKSSRQNGDLISGRTVDATGGEHDETGKFTSSSQNGNLRSAETADAIEGEHDETKSSSQNGHLISDTSNEKASRRISEAVGNEHNISRNTVIRAARFAKGLDEAEAVSPGIKDAVLTGQVKVTKAAVESIVKLPEAEKAERTEAIRRGDYARPAPNPKPAQRRGSRGADAETRALYRNARAVKEELYDTERQPEYTADDLLEEIRRIADNFISQIRRALTIRSTVLDTPEARGSIGGAIEDMEKSLRKVRKILL